MKRKLCLTSVLVLAVLAAYAAPASASPVEAVTFTSSLVNGGTWSNYDVGYSFTPTVDISVTALGYWTNGRGDVSTFHDVNIYNSDGTAVMAQTTIKGYWDGTDDHSYFNSETNSDNFLWKAITPVTLTAGQTYVMSASGSGDYLAVNPFNGVQIASDITFIQSLYDGGGPGADNSNFDTSAVFLSTPGAANSYFDGNFMFEPATAPEPATMGLLGFGLVGLYLKRRAAK